MGPVAGKRRNTSSICQSAVIRVLMFLSLEKMMPRGVRDGLKPAVHVELRKDVLHVVAHGGRAHVQALRRALRAFACRQQSEDFELAAAQVAVRPGRVYGSGVASIVRGVSEQ